jgi:hypothetical protein
MARRGSQRSRLSQRTGSPAPSSRHQRADAGERLIAGLHAALDYARAGIHSRTLGHNGGCSSTSSPSSAVTRSKDFGTARGRPCRRDAGDRFRRVPRSVHARRGGESLPVRLRRRCVAPVHVPHRPRRDLSVQAVGTAARSGRHPTDDPQALSPTTATLTTGGSVSHRRSRRRPGPEDHDAGSAPTPRAARSRTARPQES